MNMSGLSAAPTAASDMATSGACITRKDAAAKMPVAPSATTELRSFLQELAMMAHTTTPETVRMSRTTSRLFIEIPPVIVDFHFLFRADTGLIRALCNGVRADGVRD